MRLAVIILFLLLLFACAQEIRHHKEYRTGEITTLYENCSDCHMETMCNHCHGRRN
jgi:hypothetical protein